jgi:transcriptional/translational regulatory protein YebC/TACO1
VGSVAWIFDQKGVVAVDRERITEDVLLEAAMELGAEDVNTDLDDRYQVITAVSDLQQVQAGLEEKGIPVLEAGLDRFPKNVKDLSEGEAEKFLKFYEALEEQDDIQKLFANFEISDEVMEKLGS